MKARDLLAAALMIGVSGAALAADESGVYVYGSAGWTRAKVKQSEVDRLVSADYGGASISSKVDNNPTAFKFNVGYQIMPTLAIEAGYGRTGKLSYSVNSASSSEKLSVYTLGLAASFPLVDKLSLTARGGVANVRTSVDGSLAHFGGKKSRLVGGVGLKYDIDNSLSVRADWEGFRAPDAARLDNVNMLTLGVGYRF